MEGDRVLVNRLVYHFRIPGAGRRDRLPSASRDRAQIPSSSEWWPSAATRSRCTTGTYT